jgi:hypothetical protein
MAHSSSPFLFPTLSPQDIALNNTYAHVAAQKGNFPLLQHVCSQNFQILDIENEKGMLPWDLAKIACHKGLADWIFDRTSKLRREVPSPPPTLAPLASAPLPLPVSPLLERGRDNIAAPPRVPPQQREDWIYDEFCSDTIGGEYVYQGDGIFTQANGLGSLPPSSLSFQELLGELIPNPARTDAMLPVLRRASLPGSAMPAPTQLDVRTKVSLFPSGSTPKNKICSNPDCGELSNVDAMNCSFCCTSFPMPEWSCRQCTYKNTSSAVSCEMCGLS